MAAPTGPEDARNLGQPGCYVYGIVPADVELTGDVRGVGDPPGRIQLVRHGNLVALVSEVNLTRGLGTPDDLRAHAQVLDTAVVEVPVLPLRFGTVMATKDAVAGELLAVYQEAFAAALKQAEGRAQYVVREPTHELDAVHLALLADITRQDDLEQALSDLASDWEGRVEMRLLGPQAPYDFTPNPLPPR